MKAHWTNFLASLGNPIVPYFVLVLIFWGCNLYFAYEYFDPNNPGQLGDMFGIVNALFSGLAFVGLVWTIKLQNDEIESTRNDINKAQEQQEIRDFKDTFFKLMPLIRSSFDRFPTLIADWEQQKINDLIASGMVDRFDSHRMLYAIDYKNGDISRVCIFLSICINMVRLESIKDTIGIVIGHERSHIGRSVHLVEWILDQLDELGSASIQGYEQILRASLSEQEIELLAYVAAIDWPTENFRLTAQRHGLFDTLPGNLFPHGCTLDPRHTRS